VTTSSSTREPDWRLVGRDASYFGGDLAANRHRMREGIAGRRILVVGGGGSIGSITARLLLEYGPAALHVLDHSENYLADLVRDIRSGGALADDVDLRMWPVDFGGPIAQRLIEQEAPYDLIFNFAALKHVRSEKDAYSLLQMLDTNVLRQRRFKAWVLARGGTSRYFAVSTDKAANPTSLMGASKRLMEDVLIGHAAASSVTVTSARFANVAFSNGSLPQSWQRRLELGQALAVPRGTRRYFITRQEAGEICLLAGVLGGPGDILVPRLDPSRELKSLEHLAAEFLAAHGLVAVPFTDESAAREAAAAMQGTERWPLLLTPLDTSGEKPYEEFVGDDEQMEEVGFASLLAVRRPTVAVDEDLLAELEVLVWGTRGPVSKADVVRIVARAVPGLRHVETERHLDQRM
jgi:FlaA1/EpsC-like NDP-sugar epimerase